MTYLGLASIIPDWKYFGWDAFPGPWLLSIDPYLGRYMLRLLGLQTQRRVAFCCQHDVDMCKFPSLSFCSRTTHPLLHQFWRQNRIDRGRRSLFLGEPAIWGKASFSSRPKEARNDLLNPALEMCAHLTGSGQNQRA